MKLAAASFAALALLAFAAVAHAYPAHYFVVHEAQDGRLSIVSHALVDLHGTPEPRKAPARANPFERRLEGSMVEKGTGRLAFETFAVASPWLRGEFQGAGQIDGRTIANAERDYVVRVPATPGTLLRLQPQRGPSGAGDLAAATSGPAPSLEIDLDAYHLGTSLATPPAGSASGVLAQSGDPANRLDLLVVAEGYTSAQQAQFTSDASGTVSRFFSISPYADFQHLTNVAWLFVPSNQSGADKPDCPETPGAPVVFVDTAFDATYCSSGTRRLLTVNNSKVLTAAAAAPDWDFILVIVNDAEYGGSGGSVSVASINQQAAQIAQHEFGHSFMQLADEYETSFPGYPDCSDLPGSTLQPCEANVTDQTDRNLLKWSGWVSPATPIPTSGPLSDPVAAGLWQGARYKTSGMYRQCYDGIMRDLGQPFCHIEREAFVKRLYGGGWGVPAGGVSLIEPGSLPEAGNPSAPVGTDVAFQAVLAGSKGPEGLSVAWTVDGATALAQAGVNGETKQFVYHVPDTNPHAVRLDVTDNTPMLLAPAKRSRTWTVQGTQSQRVDPTVSLSSSANPSNAGQAVTFAATVSGSAGTPSGSVSFLDGANAISGCSAVALSTGSATCTTSALSTGTHSITARYPGNTSYNPATSGAITQTVTAAQSFGAPTLVSPSGTITTTTPTYTWNAVSGAVSYTLLVQNTAGVAVNATMSATSAGCGTGSGTCSATPPTALPNGTMYNWFVKAIDGTGAQSAWGGPLTITVNAAGTGGPPSAPTLVSPSGTITTTTPTYAWNAVSGAASYQLLVQNTAGVAVNVTVSATSAGCGAGSGTCAATPSTALSNNTMYNWFVKAFASDATESAWSSPRTITVNAAGAGGPPSAPTLLSPSGTIATSTPTYSWNAVSGATSYFLMVQNTAGVAVSLSISATSAGCGLGSGTCSTMPSNALANNTSYAWFVNAANGSGTGPWSDGKTIFVNASGANGPPAGPTLVSPSGSIATTTPTYTWNAVASASSYEVMVQNTAGVAVDVSIAASAAGCGSGSGTCSATPSTALAANTGYAWFVNAANASGSGPWSAGQAIHTP